MDYDARCRIGTEAGRQLFLDDEEIAILLPAFIEAAERPIDPGRALLLLFVMGAAVLSLLLTSTALFEVGILTLDVAAAAVAALAPFAADILRRGATIFGGGGRSKSCFSVAMDCLAAPAAAALAKKFVGPTSPFPFAPLLASASLL